MSLNLPTRSPAPVLCEDPRCSGPHQRGASAPSPGRVCCSRSTQPAPASLPDPRGTPWSSRWRCNRGATSPCAAGRRPPQDPRRWRHSASKHPSASSAAGQSSAVEQVILLTAVEKTAELTIEYEDAAVDATDARKTSVSDGRRRIRKRVRTTPIVRTDRLVIDEAN